MHTDQRAPRTAPGDRQGFELIAATFTPLHEDGSLNPGAINAHAALLRSQGVDGAFVGGTTGEGVSLTVAERRESVERWIEAAGGELDVVVHVGHTSLREARALAAHAATTGASAIAAIPPCYFRPADVATLADTCAEIASGAPDLPFFYYHAPSISGVELAMGDFVGVAAERIPNFAGVKFTDEHLGDFSRCLELAGTTHRILFGRDEMLLSGLALGARGAIGSTYCFAARLFRDVVDAFDRGDMAAARAAQSLARSVIDVGIASGGLPAFKTMMRWAGVDCGPCRLPLRSLDPEQQTRLRKEVDAIGALDHIARLD